MFILQYTRAKKDEDTQLRASSLSMGSAQASP